MHRSARTSPRIVMRGAPRAALLAAFATVAGQTPSVHAAPTIAALALAPTTARPLPSVAPPIRVPPAQVPPAQVPPAQAVPAAVPAVPSAGAARAPIPLTPHPLQVVLAPNALASMGLGARTVLRDALLLTGRRYTRTVVVPSSGTVQVIAELRGACDATLSFEPTSATGGDRLSATLWSAAANRRHASTLVGQRVLREYQVTPQQVANGGVFLVSVTPVAATLGGVPSELSFEIDLK
jgi:hypothetical protein